MLALPKALKAATVLIVPRWLNGYRTLYAACKGLLFT